MIWSLQTAKDKHINVPSLARLMLEIFPSSEPILDIGCGTGFYIKFLEDNGYRCRGIEGTKGIEEISHFHPIIQADLSKPLGLSIEPSNIISLEVGEHLPEEFERVFLDNIVRYAKNRILLSWGVTPPGLRRNASGCGHQNERPNEYIIERMKERGFAYDEKLSQYLRASYDEKETGAWWFKGTLMVFDRV